MLRHLTVHPTVPRLTNGKYDLIPPMGDELDRGHSPLRVEAHPRIVENPQMSVAVMISYPSEKGGLARQAYDYLRSLGLHPWFDKESLVGGDDWNREINRALDRAELFVVISSMETVKKSGTIQRELNKILDLVSAQPVGANIIINLRSENLSLPPELSKYQWLDTFDSDWRPGLLRAILKRFSQLDRELTPELITARETFERASETKIESIDVSDDQAQLTSSYLTYTNQTAYWNYINAEIVAYLYRRFYEARADFRIYHSDRRLEWALNAEEYFRKGELLSLRWHWYHDMGGAHPSYGTRTMNFAGQYQGLMTLEHLFARNDDVINYINRYAQLDIRRQLLAMGQDADIDFDLMLSGADLWDVYREYNFSDRGIVFNLSPYSVLPFVFGSYEVEMPWDSFRDKINESYKDTGIAEIVGAIF